MKNILILISIIIFILIGYGKIQNTSDIQVTFSNNKSAGRSKDVRIRADILPSPTIAVAKNKAVVQSFPKLLTENGAKNREYSLTYLSKYYSGEELTAADNILKKEAGYRTDAINEIGCGGMPQACPASKMGCALDQSGLDCQLQFFVGYITRRYGTPTQAWSHHLAMNWY